MEGNNYKSSEDDADVIIEPSKKNTAPSIIAAACQFNHHNPDAIMLIMPSDHYIPDTEILNETVQKAALAIELPDHLLWHQARPTRNCLWLYQDTDG